MEPRPVAGSRAAMTFLTPSSLAGTTRPPCHCFLFNRTPTLRTSIFRSVLASISFSFDKGQNTSHSVLPNLYLRYSTAKSRVCYFTPRNAENVRPQTNVLFEAMSTLPPSGRAHRNDLHINHYVDAPPQMQFQYALNTHRPRPHTCPIQSSLSRSYVQLLLLYLLYLSSFLALSVPHSTCC